MKEVVIDILGLNRFIPKNFSRFSKRQKYIFWDLLTKEIKRKLDFLEQHRDYSPSYFLLKREIKNFSKDDQNVNYSIYTTGPNNKGQSNQVLSPSSQILSTTSQPLSIMANRYAPLALPANLNAMLTNYSSKIKQFGADEAYTTKQHVQWFKDLCDLLKIDHEYVQMRFFA